MDENGKTLHLQSLADNMIAAMQIILPMSES